MPTEAARPAIHVVDAGNDGLGGEGGGVLCERDVPLESATLGLVANPGRNSHSSTPAFTTSDDGASSLPA
jgi:hypothetical protein